MKVNGSRPLTAFWLCKGRDKRAICQIFLELLWRNHTFWYFNLSKPVFWPQLPYSIIDAKPHQFGMCHVPVPKSPELCYCEDNHRPSHPIFVIWEVKKENQRTIPLISFRFCCKMQFSIQKVAGTISFSCFCKQKVLSTLYTSQQKVLSAFYTFTTKVLFIFY